MKIVRSVSGTWHREVCPDWPHVELGLALGECGRMVKAAKRMDWDRSAWPGARVCCECAFPAPRQ